MRHRFVHVAVALAVSNLLFQGDANGLSVCQRRSSIKLRPSKCRRGEKRLVLGQDSVDVSQLEASVAAQVASRLSALESVLAAVSLGDGGKTVRFTGVNVQIVSGSGETDGPINGTGNLLIGYDETNPIGVCSVALNRCARDDDCRDPNDRCDLDIKKSSHNLVVGPGHAYTSHSGLVVGRDNFVVAPFASVSGGRGNMASGDSTSVSGGIGNTASGEWTSVTGGLGNTANGGATSVSGGTRNTATGGYTSVSGGDNNTASGDDASVTGGSRNTASGHWASISGGDRNTASGMNASVSGGDNRTASGDLDWEAGELFEEQ